VKFFGFTGGNGLVCAAGACGAAGAVSCGTGVFEAGTVCAAIVALNPSAHTNPTIICLIFAKTESP
jgi:hypothetical protein